MIQSPKQHATIKCCRCNGTGVYMQRGTCFRCNGAGAVIADVFLRAMGTKGEFYGVTIPGVRPGTVIKSITRDVSDLMDGCTVTVITEEQARKFFKRYGASVEQHTDEVAA